MFQIPLSLSTRQLSLTVGTFGLLFLPSCATEGTFLDPDVFMPYARELMGADSAEARPEFTGRFSGEIEGQTATMDLAGLGSALTGTVELAGESWEISGEIDGLAASGEIFSAGGGQVPFTVMPTAGGLFFELLSTDPTSGAASTSHLVMERVAKAPGQTRPFGFPAPASTPPAVPTVEVPRTEAPPSLSLDPALVGAWEHADLTPDGGLELHEVFAVQPDGQFAVMTRTAEETVGMEGQLGTLDGVIYLRANDPSAEFAPWASYRIEGGQFVSVDFEGTEQVWSPVSFDGEASAQGSDENSGARTSPLRSRGSAPREVSAEWSAPRGTEEAGEPQSFFAGGHYSAGTRVENERFGVSFVVPEGCELNYGVSWQAASLRTPHDEITATAWIMNDVTAKQLVEWLAVSTDIGDRENAEPTETQVSPSGRVHVELRSPERVAHGIAQVSPDGEVLCIYAYGPSSRSDAMVQVADELLSTLRTRPATINAYGTYALLWHGEVSGYRLRQLSSYSSNTPGGGGYSSEYTLELCADGRYYSSHSDTTGFGSSGEWTDTNGYVHVGGDHAGTWHLDAWGPAGATLVLTRRDGSVVNQSLYREAGETYMNGTRAYVVATEWCN